MTDDPTPIWASIKAAVFAVPVLVTALWGGLGGATNALVIKVTALEALRHIAIGAAIAAGLGGLGAPLLGHWLGLPPGTLNAPEGAAGGTAAYLTGSLGAAVFEVLLHRIRGGRLPRDNP